MIPESLLRALEMIYAGRYGGEWEVVDVIEKWRENEPKTAKAQ